MSELVVRNSIKILLFNRENKILLMKMGGKHSINNEDGTCYRHFWQIIGGKIEENEDLITAAKRELQEETGLLENDIQFGSVVWKGNLILVINKVKTLVNQRFIVAKLKNDSNLLTLKNLTDDEKPVVERLKWFSAEEIKTSSEVIYPVGLDEYLSNLLQNGFPSEPINIVLDKKPNL